MKTKTLKFALSVLLFPLALVPALADTYTFDFYKLNANGSGASDFKPDGFVGTDYFSVTGGDFASKSLGGIGGQLKYSSNGLTVIATGTYTNGNGATVSGSVVQDHDDAWDTANNKSKGIVGAGLGVYKSFSDNSDDNVTFGEVLTLDFGKNVKITKLVMAAEGHTMYGFKDGKTFLFDGASILLPVWSSNATQAYLTPNKEGTSFTFGFDNGARTSEQFYISSITVESVPENGTTFALLGLALVGIAAARRKVSQV
jgi:hypothetical protein